MRLKMPMFSQQFLHGSSFSRLLWWFSLPWSFYFCLWSFLFLSLLFSLSLSPKVAEALEDREALRHLFVQDSQEGRIKPFDTFSREALQLVYGRETFKRVLPDKTVKIEAVDMVMMWMLWPEEWEKQDILQIRHSGLREALGLENRNKKIYFSPFDIINNPKVPLLMQELRTKRSSGEKLNPYFQAIQTLENQVNLFMGLASGALPLVMPPSPLAQENQSSHLRDGRWLPFSKLQEDEEKEAFHLIVDKFIGYAATHLAEKKGAITYQSGALKMALDSFQSYVKEKVPKDYLRQDLINWEVRYEKFQPFMWAWLLYLISVFFFATFQIKERAFLYRIGWVFLGLGLALHIYGMALRVLIQQRPPVGTMYETVIWVPFIALISAIILDWKKRQTFALICAGLVSVLCLMVSDLAPVVLNDSMKPLEPVLRDNFWLLTHVVIIVSSYGAFFLSFALADVVLFYFLCGEEKYRDKIKEGVHGIYRSIQVGFVLLTGGTILGGVWADYSWGRFWGWDPKETWALIALMGYLAILHGRLAGWIKDLGMAVGAILSFCLIIMAWYGVNFVLGAGLHSYGFGAGGVEYVMGFVALHLLYVAYVVALCRGRSKGLTSS